MKQRKQRIGWRRSERFAEVLAVLLVASWVSTSCGGSSKTGTDSHTHWLADCERDADCGNLDCICGVCSKACDEASECSELGDGAACAARAACDDSGGARLACAKTCESDGDCQALDAGLECRDGDCVARRVSPDPCPGGNCDDACRAMDARDNGDDCLQVVGYAFDGTVCRPVTCGCEGTECDELHDSLQACDAAYSECYTKLGVSRECQVNADCELTPRSCCGAITAVDAVMALSAGSEQLYEAMCGDDFGCPAIYIYPKPTLYAECVEGQCRTLDVESVAACSSDEDCLVRTQNCCPSCGTEELGDLIAVSSSEDYDDFAQCDEACAECAGGGLPEGVSAACDFYFDESGLCQFRQE